MLQSLDISKMLEFRFHHIFCIPLFKGYGYSDEFSIAMAEIKDILTSENPKLSLVCTSDRICYKCPNREDDFCNLDSVHHKIFDKDSYIAEILDLKIGANMSFSQVLELAISRVSSQDFGKVCGKCRWSEQGLCSYQAWFDSCSEILSSININVELKKAFA